MSVLAAFKINISNCERKHFLANVRNAQRTVFNFRLFWILHFSSIINARKSAEIERIEHGNFIMLMKETFFFFFVFFFLLFPAYQFVFCSDFGHAIIFLLNHQNDLLPFHIFFSFHSSVLFSANIPWFCFWKATSAR